MFGRISAVALLLVVGCGGRNEGKSPDGTSIPSATDLPFSGTQPPVNLLMLSIDTLRKDHLGVYGGGDRTPFLDGLAAEGLVATDHRQCSNWTLSATTCTVAGRDDLDRGQITRLGGGVTKIPGGTPLLAGWLADAGYATSLVTANNYFSQEWGNSQGYQAETSLLDRPAEELIDQGIASVSGAVRDGQPWMLHLHFFEPHQPYDPDPAFLSEAQALEPWPEDLTDNATLDKWRDLYPTLDPADQALLEAHFRALYSGEVRWLDAQIAAGFARLAAAGMLDRTLVVVWSDHGEQFWEHGHQGHAWELGTEETDGVLLLWGHGVTPGAIDQPTSAIDVVPTVLDRLGVAIPDEVTGVPIGTDVTDRPRFAQTVGRIGPVQSVTSGGWRLQYVWNTGGVTVYDLASDPAMLTDRYDPSDPQTQALWNLLRPRVLTIQQLTPDLVPVWPPDLP